MAPGPRVGRAPCDQENVEARRVDAASVRPRALVLPVVVPRRPVWRARAPLSSDALTANAAAMARSAAVGGLSSRGGGGGLSPGSEGDVPSAERARTFPERICSPQPICGPPTCISVGGSSNAKNGCCPSVTPCGDGGTGGPSPRVPRAIISCRESTGFGAVGVVVVVVVARLLEFPRR